MESPSPPKKKKNSIKNLTLPNVGRREAARVCIHCVRVKFYTSLKTWLEASYKLKHMYFSGGRVVKNLPANAVNASSIPDPGRPTGEWNDNPLQDSCLGNRMDTAHVFAESRIQLRDWTTVTIKLSAHLPMTHNPFLGIYPTKL